MAEDAQEKWAREALHIANSSGFPFQLAIEHLVQESQQKHGWTIQASERAWSHAETGGRGYADLVLEREGLRLVLEIKRQADDATWVFIAHPEERAHQTTSIRALLTRLTTPPYINHAWRVSHVTCSLLTARYCAIRGTGDKKGTLLERLGSELIDAAEATALEEASRTRLQGLEFLLTWPVIVTNARLAVARFNPASVSPVTGKTVEIDAIEEVDAVVFEKTLSTVAPAQAAAPLRMDAFLFSQQRSVLVVRPQYLLGLISRWHVHPDVSGRWPWSQ